MGRNINIRVRSDYRNLRL